MEEIGIVEIYMMTIRLGLIMVTILLTGCSAKSGVEIGYWFKEKPYRGTLSKNKFHISPYWQCVENNKPFNNKEC